ncbi:TPA: hypothetical protein RSW61_001930 [Vibrio harveyi]|nr:hypothetical protein [Vibrio harveyi]
MKKEYLKNITLHDIPDSDLIVTDTGKLVKASTGKEITKDVIKLHGKAARTKTILLTVYKRLDRQDLYKTVCDVWYELFNEHTYQSYIDYSLIDFCKEHNINYDHAHNAMRRNTSTSCGWYIKRKERNEKETR